MQTWTFEHKGSHISPQRFEEPQMLNAPISNLLKLSHTGFIQTYKILYIMYMKEPWLKQDLSLLPGTMTKSPLLTEALWESVIILEQSDKRCYFFSYGGRGTPKELFHANSQPRCHSIKKTVFMMCASTLKHKFNGEGKRDNRHKLMILFVHWQL